MLIQNNNTHSSASKIGSSQILRNQVPFQPIRHQQVAKINNPNCIPKSPTLSTQQKQIPINLVPFPLSKPGDNKPFSLQNQKQNTQQKKPFKISKSSSQPKFRTYKQQILRIPKVKQILNKDKFIYHQDIEKRLQLIGDVKNQNYKTKQIIQLHTLCKPLEVKQQIEKKKVKNKRHKTNYKIPLTKKNINSLNQLLHQHIQENQKFKNQQFIYLSQKDYKEPFDLKKLQFMNQINPLKKKYKEKFPELKQGVLSKNKLLLEHVILNRNIKRQMKLDAKKTKKQTVKDSFK